MKSDYVFVYYDPTIFDFSKSGQLLLNSFKSIPALGAYTTESLKLGIEEKTVYIEKNLIYDPNTRIMEADDGKYYFYQYVRK